MAFKNSNLGFQSFDELEGLGLLDEAIANASERRYSSAEQSDITELANDEATSITGGMLTPIIPVRPPITIGLIAIDPILKL